MTKDETKDVDNIVKITITKEAADALTATMSDVIEGNEAVRASRQDIASWILLNFRNTCTESDLNAIRQRHFNEGVLLEAMYRKMKETGDIPEFLRDALRKQYQAPVEGSKKTRRQVAKMYINDVQEGSEVA